MALEVTNYNSIRRQASDKINTKTDLFASEKNHDIEEKSHEADKMGLNEERRHSKDHIRVY